jgi:hypothetical protein
VRTENCETAFAPVVALRDELARSGLSVPTLIAGGSPTFAIHAGHPDRELSPGTTVLWTLATATSSPNSASCRPLCCLPE